MLDCGMLFRKIDDKKYPMLEFYDEMQFGLQNGL